MKTIEEINRSMIVARLRKVADAIEAGVPLANIVGVEAMSYDFDAQYLDHTTYSVYRSSVPPLIGDTKCPDHDFGTNSSQFLCGW